MAETVRAVVLRSSSDESTLAIVTVRRTDTVRHPDQLLDLFRNAVTAWVRETKEGAEAYENSSEDFNIGDLAVIMPNPQLQFYFNGQGLYDINIETIVNTDYQDNWTYDTRLVVDEEAEDDG